MPTPRTHHDPEGDKRRALGQTAWVAEESGNVAAAVHFAAARGATVQEISAATELELAEVNRLLEQ